MHKNREPVEFRFIFPINSSLIVDVSDPLIGLLTSLHCLHANLRMQIVFSDDAYRSFADICESRVFQLDQC